MPLEPFSDVGVSADRRRVLLSRPGRAPASVPAPWLYDNAEDALSPVGANRVRGALSLADAVTIEAARLEGDTVAVRFAPSGEERRVRLTALSPAPSPSAGAPALWTTPNWAADAPPIPFDAYLTDDDGLAKALRQVARRGLAILTGAGTEPGAVERAVARFGYIRETNYGRLFEVREEAVPSHLAYTAVGLELHTDNPYRDPVPTLQLLHAIEVASEGGESTFADGFAHAEALRAASPERFEVLATTAVEFAFEGASSERYAARAPVIERDADGQVVCVRVNHRALRAVALENAEAWYEAYLDFYRRLHAPGAMLERRLAQGDLAIFDNRRLLHGRATYRAGGGRWLQGCYAERDGLMATLARLTGAAGPAGK
jgi:alpha-ketoglutarate-dependent taurine dioxygenase